MTAAGAFWLAARPKTLLVGAAPVVLGTAAAAGDGALRPAAALAALAGALLIQVGTNFTNDVFDARSGADGPDRLGPTRAVQSGLLAARSVGVAAALAFGGAALAGIYLVALGGWPIALLGVLGIASGIAYTGGPWPLGYHGLGDLFAFAFFGLVAVGGTYYVQAGALPGDVVVAGAALGALAAAVLTVNNIRDIDTDARAGKRTLAVRLGRGLTRNYFVALLAVPYLAVLGLATDFTGLLPVATLPLALALARAVATREDGPALNAALAGTARLLALFTILWVPRWLS